MEICTIGVLKDKNNKIKQLEAENEKLKKYKADMHNKVQELVKVYYSAELISKKKVKEAIDDSIECSEDDKYLINEMHLLKQKLGIDNQQRKG